MEKLGIDSHYLNPIPIFEDSISHSQWPNPSPSNPNRKSHFPSLKIDQSQFPFYPFRTLLSNFSQHLYVFSDHTLPTRVSLSKIRWPRRAMTYLIFTVVCFYFKVTLAFFSSELHATFFPRITLNERPKVRRERGHFSKNYTRHYFQELHTTFFQELHATIFPGIIHATFFPRIT